MHHQRRHRSGRDVRAPNGELDLDLRQRVLTSMRFDPEWSRRTGEFNARKQAEAAKTSQAIMNSNAAASAEHLPLDYRLRECRGGRAGRACHDGRS